MTYNFLSTFCLQFQYLVLFTISWATQKKAVQLDSLFKVLEVKRAINLYLPSNTTVE